MINDLKWFRSADLILYAVLIVLTLQVYRLMAFEDRGEAVAVVKYDGEILGRYSLQVDQQLTLDAFEAAIFLTIEDGAVWGII